MASGIGPGRRSRSMHSRNTFTTGHGRACTRMLTTLLAEFSVTRMAICIRLPRTLPSNVTMYRPSGFLNVTGHPTAGERSLEDPAYNDMSPYLVACCRQDRRMKDNILIEGCGGGDKIASGQRAVRIPLVTVATPQSWASQPF